MPFSAELGGGFQAGGRLGLLPGFLGGDPGALLGRSPRLRLGFQPGLFGLGLPLALFRLRFQPGFFFGLAPRFGLGFRLAPRLFLLLAPCLGGAVVLFLQRRVVARLAPQPLLFEKRRLHPLDPRLLGLQRALRQELRERLAVEAADRRPDRTLQAEAQRRLRAHQRLLSCIVGERAVDGDLAGIEIGLEVGLDPPGGVAQRQRRARSTPAATVNAASPGSA